MFNFTLLFSESLCLRCCIIQRTALMKMQYLALWTSKSIKCIEQVKLLTIFKIWVKLRKVIRSLKFFTHLCRSILLMILFSLFCFVCLFFCLDSRYNSEFLQNINFSVVILLVYPDKDLKFA